MPDELLPHPATLTTPAIYEGDITKHPDYQVWMAWVNEYWGIGWVHEDDHIPAEDLAELKNRYEAGDTDG